MSITTAPGSVGKTVSFKVMDVFKRISLTAGGVEGRQLVMDKFQSIPLGRGLKEEPYDKEGSEGKVGYVSFKVISMFKCITLERGLKDWYYNSPGKCGEDHC